MAALLREVAVGVEHHPLEEVVGVGVLHLLDFSEHSRKTSIMGARLHTVSAAALPGGGGGAGGGAPVPPSPGTGGGTGGGGPASAATMPSIELSSKGWSCE